MSIVLGIKAVGHDTGAALMAHGRVVAIAEERLNRIKYSGGFPELSITYCLRTLEVAAEEVVVVVTEIFGNEWERVSITKDLVTRFPNARIIEENHHDAHAATAFFCSSHDDAAVLVYDGNGDAFSVTGIRSVETETLYHGSGNMLTQIDKTLHPNEGNGFTYTSGIGALYSRLSEHYLQLGAHNEGKMMGLASYGDDSLLRSFPIEQWFIISSGHEICNAEIFFPKTSVLEHMREGRFFKVLWSAFRSRAKRILSKIRRQSPAVLDPKVFNPIRLTRPARDPMRHELPDAYYSSVAYAAQKIFEQFAVAIGTRLKAATKSDVICIAGGCALNIDANMNFLHTVGFKKLFVQPASSDAGVALGFALLGLHRVLNEPRQWVMQSASLGRAYSDTEIQDSFDSFKETLTFRKSDDIVTDAARRIAAGQIIGWVQGGSEYGPRALGHRSILCDPRGPTMKDTLNIRVKHRETWRPFAASVLLEHLSQWFAFDGESPFMLVAAPVVEDKRLQIPAVVHVDGTCRMQSLTPEVNGRYYELVSAFHQMTGVPLLLNTSFNLGGEPIVETPWDALHTFNRTDMDCLIIEDWIIEKKPLAI